MTIEFRNPSTPLTFRIAVGVLIGVVIGMLCFDSDVLILVSTIIGGVLAYSANWRVTKRLLRRRRGHCVACGYDLRSDFSQGCPECGWGR